MKYFMLGLVTGIVGELRFYIPGHNLSWPGTYEAMAHIWVGILLTIICCNKFQPKDRIVSGILLTLITVLETVMFLNR